MRPITQASHDPKLNDTGHLRADQPTDGAFGLAILNRGTERVLRCGEGARKRSSLPDFVLFSIRGFCCSFKQGFYHIARSPMRNRSAR
ncbi:MAG: hypothetical protein RL069_750 [Planctomycetota bacterium]|jgi:hypothetical protein